MERRFRLEYWIDDGWYVGRLKEVPGVFSQGESLEELEESPFAIKHDVEFWSTFFITIHTEKGKSDVSVEYDKINYVFDRSKIIKVKDGKVRT